MGDNSTTPGGHHRIGDYAMIGDLHTAALVGPGASIDWLCMPRFDSPACFAALLGSEDNGYWSIRPAGDDFTVYRGYRDETLILVTEFRTRDGIVAVIDFMPHGGKRERTDVVRIVEGRGGEVEVLTKLVFRFDYGRIIPWVKQAEGGISAIAGPDALRLWTPVTLRGADFRTTGRFTVKAGETVPFVLTCFRSWEAEPPPLDAISQLGETERWWCRWSSRCRYDGPRREAVVRSVLTLKALTYNPTGGVVAAPTTSLPEAIGGRRNWDYRYCWVRDAAFTLYALLISGFREEASAWREWLLRSVAGSPQQLQVLYAVAGERRLPEFEIPWLEGYEGSRPVRIGNGAADQYQLDIYGELMDAFYVARHHGLEPTDDSWAVQCALLEFLESNWDQPDDGIWETRGPRRDFTYSKVMAWVALDRAVRTIQEFQLDGPEARWRSLRDRLHADICERGYDRNRNTFVQYYGGSALDGALLLLPLVGFLPASDRRIAGTVEAIQRQLVTDGLVRRYETNDGVDGLEEGEGVFLACSFWLADNLALMGRHAEATRIFTRVLRLRNDVGLLSEEYDPSSGRLLGNFPQAFSHVALINSAHNLNKVPTHIRQGVSGAGS